MKNRTTVVVSLLGLGLVALLGGCPTTPPAEAVLAGTWELVPSEPLDPPLTNWFLTFNSDGDLTQVSYTFAGVPTVTWNDPPGTTNVDGTNVSIAVTQSGSGLSFTGTLNSTNDVITGALQSNLVVGGVTISIPQGPATMTKQ